MFGRVTSLTLPYRSPGTALMGISSSTRLPVPTVQVLSRYAVWSTTWAYTLQLCFNPLISNQRLNEGLYFPLKSWMCSLYMISEFRKQFCENCTWFSRSRRSSKKQQHFPTSFLVSCTVLQFEQRRKVSETVFL